MHHRLWLLSSIIVSGLAFTTSSAAAQQAAESTMHMMKLTPEISTSAQGEARYTPDRAHIYIGVETRAKTAEQAGAENAKRQQAVIDAIESLGIGKELISTVNYNVYPEREYHPDKGDKEPRIVGYNVTNTVRVEVRDISRVGTVIDTALSKGANNINSLDFYSSNEDGTRRQALAEAVGRAHGDAEALAKAAGGSLGDLIELSSAPISRQPRPMPMMMAKADASFATPINPGEQTLTVTVAARWHFIEGQ